RFRWLVYGYVLWIWLWGCLRKLHLHRSKVSISFLSDGVLQEFVLFFGLDGSFWIVVALMEESHCRIRGKVTDSPLGSRYVRRSYVQGKSREFGIDIGSVLGIFLRLIVRRRNPCRSAVWDLISIERCFQGMAYYDCPDRILGFVILSASVEGKFSEADLLGAMIIYLSTLKTESCVSLAVLTKLALNKGKAAMVSIQRMDSLVTNMPKIWKLEDKVVGADLGKGTFQFNFQSEEDLQGVLQNAPYHFDGWMVVLVRWEPIISSTYPSAINFWVKVSGIPMHLWEEATLEAVGKKVGLIREIDVDSGSFHAT
ncbi:unnamed protein product, partial [Arabidopsis halleri]